MNLADLRIVFMGTPDFAVAPLRALVEAGCNVVAVVTVADKPAGRGLLIKESPVKKYAVQHSIEVLQPLKLKDTQFVEQFRALNIDLAIVVAFRMLPEVIWNEPKYGTFNLHASLLPYYRGAAPINWAIINGDTKTGVTTFFLNHQIDCGDVIDAVEVEILPNENVGQLHDKLMSVGAELVVKTVQKIASGNYETRKQVPVSDSVRILAPKIFKDDCKIDWTKNVVDVYNKIRGLSPYPAAWCEFDGNTYKIFDVKYEKCDHNDTFGEFTNYQNRQLKVPCSGGYIFIDTLQPAGKRSMSSEEFLRGHKL